MVGRLRSGLLRLAFMLALAVWLEAAPSADVVSYLKSRPTDREQLKTRLKSALTSRQYEDAYVIGRYLRKHLNVKGAKLSVVLASLAERLDRRDEARGYAREALRSDPGSAKAQAILSRLQQGHSILPGGPAAAVAPASIQQPPATGSLATVARPTSGTLSPLCEEATRFYYEDRYDKALSLANKAIAASADDIDAVLLKSHILGARMETDAAAKLLLDAMKSHPSQPRVYQRLAELALDEFRVLHRPESLQAAANFYDKALEVGPDDPATLLSISAFFYMMNQPEKGGEYHQKAMARRPFSDREMALNDAMLVFLQGRQRDALDMLSAYTRTFGTDSGSLLCEGLVRLKLGEKEDAGECLEHAFKRNPQNLAAILNVVPVLVTMDQSDRALKVISAAEAEYPESAHVATLKRQIKIRVLTDKDLVETVRGPFRYTHPKWLESEKKEVFDAIHSAFEAAYRDVTGLYDHRPDAVKVRVTLDTGLDVPAFYSSETDVITISAQWFFEKDPGVKFSVKPEAVKAMALHMIRHEFSHMVYAHKLGCAEQKNSSPGIPLWMLEGVAEWSAGGMQVLLKAGKDVKAYFSDGFLEGASQDLNMRVSNGSKDPRLNQKAYVQSFFMVKYLVGRGAGAGATGSRAGLVKFCAFSADVMAAKGKIDEALRKNYGLGPDEFKKGWQALLQRDVIDAPAPRLASTEGAATGTGAAADAGGPSGDDLKVAAGK